MGGPEPRKARTLISACLRTSPCKGQMCSRQSRGQGQDQGAEELEVRLRVCLAETFPVVLLLCKETTASRGSELPGTRKSQAAGARPSVSKL